MVFKKKSKEEKEIFRLTKQIAQVDDQIEQAFGKSKEYSKKGDEGKSVQSQTRWAILIDKRKIMVADLEKLRMVAPGSEDKTLKFEEETAEKFYEFLEKNDSYYHCYLKMIEKNPAVFKEVQKICAEFLKKGKEIPNDYILERSKKSKQGGKGK